MPTWIWWALVWWIGFTQVGRPLFLWAEQVRDVKNEHRSRTYIRKLNRHDSAEYWLAACGAIAWPVTLAVWLTIKVMFPRGLRTKRAKQLQREAEEKKRKDQAARLDRASRRLVELHQQQQLAIADTPADAEKASLAYDQAEREFAEACEAVWNSRGQKWSIGSLANVRTRRSRAKVAA